jgi:activator of HSP90 ATPase
MLQSLDFLQAILKAVQTYVSELRSGVPAQQSSTGAAAVADTAAAAPAAKSAAAAGSNGASSATGAAAAAAAAPAASKSKSRCTVKLTEKFYARALDIFECFTVQGRVQAFTRSPAVVEPQPGGSFSWFNGHVQVCWSVYVFG